MRKMHILTCEDTPTRYPRSHFSALNPGIAVFPADALFRKSLDKPYCKRPKQSLTRHITYCFISDSYLSKIAFAELTKNINCCITLFLDSSSPAVRSLRNAETDWPIVK